MTDKIFTNKTNHLEQVYMETPDTELWRKGEGQTQSIELNQSRETNTRLNRRIGVMEHLVHESQKELASTQKLLAMSQSNGNYWLNRYSSNCNDINSLNKTIDSMSIWSMLSTVWAIAVTIFAVWCILR